MGYTETEFRKTQSIRPRCGKDCLFDLDGQDSEENVGSFLKEPSDFPLTIKFTFEILKMIEN